MTQGSHLLVLLYLQAAARVVGGDARWRCKVAVHGQGGDASKVGALCKYTLIIFMLANWTRLAYPLKRT